MLLVMGPQLSHRAACSASFEQELRCSSCRSCTEGVVRSCQHAKNCCCCAGGANNPAAPQLHDARALPRMLQLKTHDEPEVCFTTASCSSECRI